MISASSVKITESTSTDDTSALPAPVEYKFIINNGNTGETVISDPLLDSYDRAKERALSEFLKQSYALRSVSFSTYRTDFAKNMIINVKGLPYIIKGITTAIDNVSIKTSIKAVRYE